MKIIVIILIWSTALYSQVVISGGVSVSGGVSASTPSYGFQKSRIGVPSGTPKSVCDTSLLSATAYYLTADVDAGKTLNISNECFNFPQGVTLDCQGHTVNGVIGTNGSLHGSTLKNCRVRCVYPDVSISTVTTTAVSATGSQTVGVNAPVGMDAGVKLAIDSGGNAETVIITSVDYTNRLITAVFTKAHLSAVGLVNAMPPDVNNPGCVQLVAADNATASLLIDNNDVLNSEGSTNSRAFYNSWNPASGSGSLTGLNGQTYVTLFRYNTIADVGGCANSNACSRMHASYFEGLNQSIESTFNDITLDGGSAAGQGIAYWYSTGRIAFNRCNAKAFLLDTNTFDTSRCFLIDAGDGGTTGDLGVEEDSNLCTANDNRCFRDRDRIGRIHDNLLLHVAANHGAGAFHIMDQDASDDYVGSAIWNNTIEMCGGVALMGRGGFNFLVRDNKVIGCNGGALSGSFADVQALNSPAQSTTIFFQRNGVVSNPNIKFSHTGTASSSGSILCNSGNYDSGFDAPTVSTGC